MPLPQLHQEDGRGPALLFPSIPLPRSPSTPPNSSPHSPHAQDWWSPLTQTLPKCPLALQIGIRPEVVRVSKEYPGCGPTGFLTQGDVPATNASRLVSFALTRRFLGRFRTDSKRWRTYPRLHEGRSGILYVVSALVMSYFAGAGERGTSQATG